MSGNTGFLIPVYNHGVTLDGVVQKLLPFGFPIIVIDDGNDEKNRSYIEEVDKKYDLVTLVTRKKNGGKGRAMNDGLLKAHEMGLSHVFQLDADGQHDVNDCSGFLEASACHPDAIINGYPIYDESVPAARKNGREFSNKWARVVAVNKNIRDVLCGFRIYPVEPFYDLLRHHAWLNGRMGYDVDILVHLLWKNLPIINKGVHVTYPADGVSNFRVVRDNLGIAGTFSRLCIGMFVRSPVLIFRAIKRRKTADEAARSSNG